MHNTAPLFTSAALQVRCSCRLCPSPTCFENRFHGLQPSGSTAAPPRNNPLGWRSCLGVRTQVLRRSDGLPNTLASGTCRCADKSTQVVLPAPAIVWGSAFRRNRCCYFILVSYVAMSVRHATSFDRAFRVEETATIPPCISEGMSRHSPLCREHSDGRRGTRVTITTSGGSKDNGPPRKTSPDSIISRPP